MIKYFLNLTEIDIPGNVENKNIAPINAAIKADIGKRLLSNP